MKVRKTQINTVVEKRPSQLLFQRLVKKKDEILDTEISIFNTIKGK